MIEEQIIEEKVNKKLLELLTIVDPRLIVTQDIKNGVIYVGGERVEDGRLMNLKSEAEFLLNSEIWKVLYETPKHLAQRALFVDSKSLEDLQKGKSMLHTLDTQKNILELFKSVKKK